MRIAIIGLGLLGTVVARRLLERGFEVVGHDLRPERVEALRAHGLRSARSVADAAVDADIVFTLLPSEESVELVVRGPRGLLERVSRDATLCQMSTISPGLVRSLAEAAAAAGTGFLDTPISGNSGLVARGEGTIFVGGDVARAELVRPVLGAIAADVIHIGEVGTASVAKLAANLISGVTAAALAEALVLAAKAGLEPAKLVEALRHSGAASRVLNSRGPLMASRRFEPQSTITLFLKDFGLMLAEGRRVGAALPLTSLVQQLCVSTAAAGRAEQDLAAVITTFERLAGPGVEPSTPPAPRRSGAESSG